MPDDLPRLRRVCLQTGGEELLLDDEKFAPEADDDLDIRQTNVELHSFGSSAQGVEGQANAESASIWARRRVPTGSGTAIDRPLRQVYEVALARFLGNETEIEPRQMSSVGFGPELDTSAHDIWVTRMRAVVRCKFSPGVSGRALGLPISFDGPAWRGIRHRREVPSAKP